MNYFLLNLIQDSTKMISKAKAPVSTGTNYWPWIAAVELGIIVFITVKLLSKNRKQMEARELLMMEEAKSSKFDTDNLVKSIYKSQELYKRLSSKCHPDRFANDEEKRVVADKLFREITKNKRNYSKLLELKVQALESLDIHI